MHREVIRQYLKCTEPDKVAARLGNVAIRRTFYAAGVNHFWAMDQHDKWKRFGLFWHGCVDGFSGKILWLVIWWTNSNPRFVCAQYVKAVRTVGGMSLSFLSLLCAYLMELRCAMRHPKRPGHRELQRGICAHTYPPCARSYTHRLHSTQLEAWSHKHQTRTNVVAIPSNMGLWF
jgi:hypothetical protein